MLTWRTLGNKEGGGGGGGGGGSSSSSGSISRGNIAFYVVRNISTLLWDSNYICISISKGYVSMNRRV